MPRDGNMVFQRFGRSIHLKIESAADLARACELDEALWVATNAPVSQLRTDATLLSMLDADGKGRITVRELKAVIRWMLETLTDHSGIDAGSDVLQRAALNVKSKDGQRIENAVRKMLPRVGKRGQPQIRLGEVRKIRQQVEATPVS